MQLETFKLLPFKLLCDFKIRLFKNDHLYLSQNVAIFLHNRFRRINI